jgi:hypothetical protein
MIKLNPDTSTWYMQHLDDTIRSAEEQKPNGNISAYRLGDYKKIVRKAMKIDQELPKEVDEFLTGLQNKTLGVVPVKVYDIMSYN